MKVPSFLFSIVVILSAVSPLHGCSGSNALDDIEEFRDLNHPDPALRKKALTSLGKSPDKAKKVVNRLLELFTDNDPEVRVLAIAAIGNIGPDAELAIKPLKTLIAG